MATKSAKLARPECAGRLFVAVLGGLLCATGVADEPELEVERLTYSVDTAAPSRDRLFQLRTEGEILDELASEFQQRYPDELFLTPIPHDDFDRADAPLLGASWFQNRNSGEARDAQGRRGDMRIENVHGLLPPKRFEAAILNEAPATRDISIAVDVRLSDASSRFGVIFRALDPDRSTTFVDQLRSNSFGFAWASTTQLAVGIVRDGTVQVLDRKSLPELREFRLTVTARGDLVTASRNGNDLLTVAGEWPGGEYVGLIGHSGSAPVSFDNFRAAPFAGVSERRSFVLSQSPFESARVPYRPIYFEHVGIERYGHHVGNLFQPALEHAAFFIDTATFPARLIAEPPWECQSSLGYCAPGQPVWPPRLAYPGW